MRNITASVRTLATKLMGKKEYTAIGDCIIPSPDRRWCGPKFKDDSFFLASAEAEAKRLIDHCGLTPASRLLDVGSGQGRLAIGLIRTIGSVDYTGIDIHEPSIAWCAKYIAARHPQFKFSHLNVYNERYNAEGVRLDGDFKFALPAASIDLIYLFSVFSHTTEEDMRVYLREFKRVLAPGGRIFFTTFVEENVPDISINPTNYRLRCDGPLHVVRYERAYLYAILADHGFDVFRFTHATEADGQSALYLKRALQNS